MTIRAALLLSCVFVAGALPARAQGPGGPPPNYRELATQIADLQARIAKLEGNITATDLAGSYSVLVLDTNLDGANLGGQVPSITTRLNKGTLALNADGTGSVTGGTCEGSRLTLGGVLTGVSCDEGSNPGVTWTYANGVVTLTFLDDGDEIPLNVAAGGRLLTTAFSPFHASDPSSNHVLFLLTRLR